ncbi:WxL domain-containing protein [Enterococcus sp. DIV0876]|uniref:WxL domain-containing protein n=1 Tax=Enterococcus sp. DIV0876 TaxID=2774633 RepID=UPI003D2FFB6C
MRKKMLVVGLISLGCFIAPVNGFAEVEKTSDVNFSIDPGTLSLEQVTSFSFGTSRIGDIALGQQELDAAANQESLIYDFRGENESGWRLTAKLSKLTNEVGDELTGQVHLKGSKGSETTAALVSEAVLEAGIEEPTAISSADGKTGLGPNSFDFSETTLTIPQQNVNSGEYKGTITWTLEDTYQPSI